LHGSETNHKIVLLKIKISTGLNGNRGKIESQLSKRRSIEVIGYSLFEEKYPIFYI